MNGAAPIRWDGLFGFVLIFSVAATFLVALLLRRLYRKRIKEHMRGKGAPAARDTEPPDAPQIDLREYDSLPDLSPEAEELYSTAALTPRRAAFVYALAGVAHALVISAVTFLISSAPYSAEGFVVVALAMAWPILPTVVIVALADRRMQIAWPVLLTVVILLASGPYRNAVGVLWLTQMLVPTAAMFLVANWWMRAIGPVMLVFFSVFFFGLLVSPFAGMYATNDLLKLDSVQLFFTATAFVVMAFAAAACVFIARVGRRYGRKQVSDQLVVLNLYWLLVTEWECLLLATETGVLKASLGLAAYAAYRGVLWLGLRRFECRAARRGNVKLLLLRVFGSPERSERTLEELGLRWRYAGSIQLIAGEDLALANLEPDELIDFLTLRLTSHFIKNDAELEEKISQIDLEPDPDGRFRVNEFFCDDAAWRGALLRLVKDNDVVLMDLRGFKRDRRGVVYELTQLINVKPVSKTVMIVDSETETDYLRRVLSAAWHGERDYAHNPRTPAEPLRFLRVEKHNSREALRLLRVLCAAARNA